MEAANANKDDMDEILMQRRLKVLEQVGQACFLLDKDKDGVVTREEVEEGVMDANVAKLLPELSLPYGAGAEEVFTEIGSSRVGLG